MLYFITHLLGKGNNRLDYEMNPYTTLILEQHRFVYIGHEVVQPNKVRLNGSQIGVDGCKRTHWLNIRDDRWSSSNTVFTRVTLIDVCEIFYTLQHIYLFYQAPLALSVATRAVNHPGVESSNPSSDLTFFRRLTKVNWCVPSFLHIATVKVNITLHIC